MEVLKWYLDIAGGPMGGDGEVNFDPAEPGGISPDKRDEASLYIAKGELVWP